MAGLPLQLGMHTLSLPNR